MNGDCAPFRTFIERVHARRVLNVCERRWCHGILEQKNTNRSRKINGKLVNFIAKFDMDEMSTDLALQSEDYDPSPSAEYESWLLLEEVRLALE